MLKFYQMVMKAIELYISKVGNIRLVKTIMRNLINTLDKP